MLVWTGDASVSLPAAPPRQRARTRAPLAYTPPHLTEKILTARPALEGERKQVTVLFADLKDSTELIRGLDPEAAQQLLDPALHLMMDAVHRFEGTVNQVLGDGIMALFGAPIAHEDHALRACYAALAMQAAMRAYYRGGAPHPRPGAAHARGPQLRGSGGAGHWQRPAHGLLGRRGDHGPGGAHGTDGHAGEHPPDRQPPCGLVEGLVQVTALGPVPVKGLAEPVEVFELVGASALRRRLQAAAARGLTRFVGRQHGAGGAAPGAGAGAGRARPGGGAGGRGGRGQVAPGL